jgi:hypothetical protein
VLAHPDWRTHAGDETRMLEIANARINSFASKPEATAQPSEEIFVLTSNQLEAILSQAIERATAPLEARLENLERGVGCRVGGEDARIRVSSPAGAPAGTPAGALGSHILTLQEVRELRDRLEDLEEATARERAYDRQRLARLEKVDPQPLQKDRGEILRALIAANGGKMLAKEARKKMHLSKQAFTNLLATVEGIESRPYRIDKRQKLLILK